MGQHHKLTSRPVLSMLAVLRSTSTVAVTVAVSPGSRRPEEVSKETHRLHTRDPSSTLGTKRQWAMLDPRLVSTILALCGCWIPSLY